VEVQLRLFLTSATDGDKWSASRSDRLTPSTGPQWPVLSPQQVWTEWREEKSVLSRIQPRGLMIVMTKPSWQQVMYIAVNWLCLRCISWVCCAYVSSRVECSEGSRGGEASPHKPGCSMYIYIYLNLFPFSLCVRPRDRPGAQTTALLFPVPSI
jgi:hypothetical protein